MTQRGMQPVVVPSDFWQRVDVLEALAARDITAFVPAASPLVGCEPAAHRPDHRVVRGPRSKIMSGRPAVTAYEVFERIASGLAMPDHARHARGLAPEVGTVEASTASDRWPPRVRNGGVRDIEPTATDERQTSSPVEAPSEILARIRNAASPGLTTMLDALDVYVAHIADRYEEEAPPRSHPA